MTTNLFCDNVLLPEGWSRNVTIRIDDDLIAAIAPGSQPQRGDERVAIALPGLPNLHSHAFQRGMAGLTEIGGPSVDSFWTWRDVMYRFLQRVTPDDVSVGVRGKRRGENFESPVMPGSLNGFRRTRLSGVAGVGLQYANDSGKCLLVVPKLAQGADSFKPDTRVRISRSLDQGIT